jgi:hypothetical protein
MICSRSLPMAFDGGFGAHLELPRPVDSVDDALPAQDESAGGEIRPLHDLEDFVERRVGMLDQLDGGVDDLGEIVRRNVGRHADRDARRSVDQQVGNARRQHFRLLLAARRSWAEIDGLLVEIFEQRGGDARQARFGVPVAAGGSPSTEPKLPCPSTSG